jgi:hypothetical protein
VLYEVPSISICRGSQRRKAAENLGLPPSVFNDIEALGGRIPECNAMHSAGGPHAPAFSASPGAGSRQSAQEGLDTGFGRGASGERDADEVGRMLMGDAALKAALGRAGLESLNAGLQGLSRGGSGGLLGGLPSLSIPRLSSTLGSSLLPEQGAGYLLARAILRCICCIEQRMDAGILPGSHS